MKENKVYIVLFKLDKDILGVFKSSEGASKFIADDIEIENQERVENFLDREDYEISVQTLES